MLAPRCDIYFDANLVTLKEFYIPLDAETSSLDEFSKVEERVNTKSLDTDELKEILQKVEEFQ